MRIDNQKVASVNDQNVADACIHMMDALQDYNSHEQTMAIIAMFRMWISIFQLDVRDSIAMVDRMLADNDDNKYWDYRFSAVRAYIEGELKDG